MAGRGRLRQDIATTYEEHPDPVCSGAEASAVGRSPCSASRSPADKPGESRLSAEYTQQMIVDALPQTATQLAADIDRGLHLGGQLSVRSPKLSEDFPFGEVRPGEAMRTDHRMLWMSASKPLTAVAIAQQYEEGVIDFDDRVADHIPEFGTGGKEDITVRHLLTHTSGIRMFSTGWPDRPWDEIVAAICSRKIEPGWVPGEKAGYHSESSWFILGEILQRASGLGVSEYLQERVLAPAGMGRTHLGMSIQTWQREQPLIAPIFDTSADGSERPVTGERYLVPPSPAANAVGPISELADFYLALVRGGQGLNGRLLVDETTELLTSRHRTGMFDHTFKIELDWGLGFILNPSSAEDRNSFAYGYGPRASQATFGHSGRLSVVAFADPTQELAVALAWNGTPAEVDHRRRVAETLDALYVDVVDGG